MGRADQDLPFPLTELMPDDAVVDELAQEADRLEDQRNALAVRLEEQLEIVGAQMAELQRKTRVLQDALARVRAGRRKAGDDGRMYLSWATTSPATAADDGMDLSSAKTSEAIWFAIAAHPHGVTADGIRNWVSQRGKALGTKAMHTALHRMIADRRVLAQGKRGTRTYLLGPKKEDGVMASG